MDTSGNISTVAGNGTQGFAGDGGLATSANLNSPMRVMVDQAGNLYVADAGNHRIRKIDTSGNISTVAGNSPVTGTTSTGGYTEDGVDATGTKLNDPHGIAIDGSGNLYIADTGNNRVRKLSSGSLGGVTYTIDSLSDQTLKGLTAGYESGTQETKIVTVTRTGTGDLKNLTAALSGTNAGSFTVTQPTSNTLDNTTTSATFTVKANDSLAAGTYTATITVSADNMDDVTFTVTQVVSAPLTYTIAAIDNQTLTALTAGYTSGTQETKTITVTRTGTGDLANLTAALSGTNAGDFVITAPSAATLNSTTTLTTFTVKAKDGLAAGTYTATVTIKADKMTDVTFTVTQVVNAALTYTIAAIENQTLTTLAAGYTSGTQQTKTITVTRTGTGDLANLTAALSGTNAGDFVITAPSAATLNGTTTSTTFTVKAKDGLAAGTYTATVTIKADKMTDVTFTVTQVVSGSATYTVTYAKGDYGTLSAASETVASGGYPSAVPSVTPDSGYKFEGWSSDGGITKLTSLQVAAVTVTGDITYTAYYTKVIIKGDIGGDGKITNADALLLTQYLKNTATLTEEQKQAADVDGDGNLDTDDVKAILAMCTKKGV